MKNYKRAYPLFSLCGLNCGLCPMHVGGYCPGCGGGEGHQSCAVIRCSQQHGNPEFCTDCPQFPCERYADGGARETFVPYRNRLRDLARARELGPDAYVAELEEKMALLRTLLDGYNDGRRKSLYCLAVNLLDRDTLKQVLAQLPEEPDLPVKERAAQAAALLRAAADRQGIVLKLNKKNKANAP